MQLYHMILLYYYAKTKERIYESLNTNEVALVCVDWALGVFTFDCNVIEKLYDLNSFWLIAERLVRI